MPTRNSPIPPELDFPQQVDELRCFVRQALPAEARIAIQAGSGLGCITECLSQTVRVDYDRMPHVGGATVAGHGGSLHYGLLGGVPVFVLNGRRHMYEGKDPRLSTILLRALLLEKRIGTVILTNAAGGLNPEFSPGDLMLISDHVNMCFRNVLAGPNPPGWGVRFPDMSDCYSRRLRAVARETARDESILLREGVYAGCTGPVYETPAEARMLRAVCGADAVGMSTVQETLVAQHMGREALGFSLITNSLARPGKTSHEEVLTCAAGAAKVFVCLMKAVTARLGRLSE